MSSGEKNSAGKEHCGRRLYRWSGSRVGDATTIDSGRYRVRVCVFGNRQLARRFSGRRSRGKTVRYWRLRRRRRLACYIVIIFSFSFLAGRRPAVGAYNIYIGITYIFTCSSLPRCCIYTSIHNTYTSARARVCVSDVFAPRREQSRSIYLQQVPIYNNTIVYNNNNSNNMYPQSTQYNNIIVVVNALRVLCREFSPM